MLPIAETAATAVEYVFPNEHGVHWNLMIVLYPYISGMVAGSFVLSSLYHVFRIKSLKPLAGFALLFALAFLSCAVLPLLIHLGQPTRALSMFLTPNPSSAMGGFGYLYLAYGVLLVLEIFFIYRPTLVARQQASRGIRGFFYQALSMASDNLSAEALELDRRIIRILAVIGLVLAFVLPGYVGFVFGDIKANPLWDTPLMPVVFFLSACVSGFAGIILTYVFLMMIGRRAVDVDCLRTAVRFLWGFMALGFACEMLKVFSHDFLDTGHWHALHRLLWGPLYQTYWVWQVGVLTLIPLVLLGVLVFPRTSGMVVRIIAPLAAVMALLQVLVMRWNVVIGGQLMSKSGRGWVFYKPGWLEKEGFLLALVILVLPVLVLYLLGKVFPFWQDERRSIESAKQTS